MCTIVQFLFVGLNETYYILLFSYNIHNKIILIKLNKLNLFNQT